MTFLEAIILGIVEGLTEFLPVSSTGHLILTASLLGVEKTLADNYCVVIQLGAILSVLWLYRARATQMTMGLLGRDPGGLQLFLKLVVAFMPAAVLGLLLDDLIEAALFSPLPVVGALIVGGIAMILVEKRIGRGDAEGANLKTIEQATFRDAFLVGCFQCLAMWPGTSRSMATILGARICGFKMAAAAEFSFLLALPTLGGATALKLLKDHEVYTDIPGGIPLLLVGNVVAFFVALLAMRWFVGFVTRHGMTPFGWYRIVLGIAFLAAWLAGYVTM